MRRFAALALAAAMLPVASAGAQVIPVYGVLYRPPGVRYEVLRSRHFELIHQVGTRDRAAELAAILEDAIPSVSTILPVRDDFRMPVVLSDYTDRGNGYVTPIAFRQEIDAMPFGGLSVSPRHASWLETVAPHELVHAVQADFRGGFGVGGLVRLAAPDMARAMNLWVPPGISEGAAIHVESLRGEGVGRLNYGYHLMQYRAAAGSGDPWSLAQALEASVYTRPTDRHYIGGGAFVDWYLDEFGPDAFRRVTRVHNRFPLLGYGLSLWIATGRPPWALGRAFRRNARETESARQAAIGDATRARPLSGARGMVHRRPRWLDDRTLVVYMTAYDRTRGLYILDTETGRLRPLAHEEMTSDLRFAVRDREPRLVFARFLADPFSPLAYGADLFTLDTGSGEARRLTQGAHLLYPVAVPDGEYLAVENSQRGGAIVRVDPGGTVSHLVSDPDLRIVGLDVDRATGKILAVANRNGSQGIWLLDRERADGPMLEFALGMRGGSVLDASWTPGGERIVFSADRDGELDVYVHHPESGSTLRLTRTLYGAMEPAVSPDGSRIAYVRYGPERFDLVVEPFLPAAGVPVDSAVLLDAGSLPGPPAPDPAASPWVDPEPRPYRAARYLRPRMIYPTLYYEDAPAAAADAGLGFGAGLAVQGADPLLRWSYWGEGIWRKGRAWGEAGVVTAAVVTRPALRLYSRPEEVTVLVRPSQGPAFTRRVIREERGARLGMQLPVVLSNNVRSSTMAAGAGLQFEEERLYDDEMQPLTDFLGRLTATGSVSLGLGVQWNLRDLVPSRGLLLGLAGESDLQAENADLRQAAIGTAALYLPWLSRLNVGLRLEAGWVAQSEPSVFDLDYFMPRGQEDLLPVNRSVVRLGAETVVPVVFVDDGMLILPVYIAAVYVYGFGETLLDSETITSVGGGIGVQVRLFHALGLDLRFGAARRVNRDDWTVVYR